MNVPSLRFLVNGSYCGRILTEQVAGARSCLGRFVDEPDTAIHELRKHGKRIRSILLLTKSGIGLETFVRSTDLVRSAARRFSDARDARVLCDTLANPALFGEDEFDSFGLEPMRDWLSERHGALLLAPELISAVAAAEGELAETAERLAGVSWEHCTEAGIKEGWARNFERGCEARIRARLTRHPEDLHDWRKRAKTLSVHLQVISGEFGALDTSDKAAQADLLGSLLGEHHDLAVLDALLRGKSELDGPARQAVSARIVERQLEIENESFELGAQVFDYELLG
jgi:CHAD domain-containing protein